MNNDQIEKLEKSIINMKGKKSRLFFVVQDTKGNAKAAVRYIYQMAMSLRKSGYNPVMLHEKPDYEGVGEWLGEEYMEIEHKPIEGSSLEISPDDLIIVPEIYGFIMDQITKLPCGKIVLSQCQDYIYETLQPGQSWSQLGFLKCITTTEQQKEYIRTTMRNVSIDVIEPVISDCFVKSEYPAKTIVNIHTRDHRDTTNLIKVFYSKFPQYRWITFRDLRGLTEKEYIRTTMRNVSIDVIEPVISDCFVKSEYPAKTIVNIHTRDHRDTTNLIKVFYSKFPQYRWITFRDLRGLTEKEFSQAMKDSFVSVWVDQNGSYGTFPLESMKVGVPVIGLVPDLIPSWMDENNGVWINNKTMLVDVLSDFIQNWLEDNINPSLIENMESTVNSLQTLDQFETKVIELFDEMLKVRLESFEAQLNKLQVIEE
jgi:uncharacterized protein with HEPN domain